MTRFSNILSAVLLEVVGMQCVIVFIYQVVCAVERCRMFVFIVLSGVSCTGNGNGRERDSCLFLDEMTVIDVFIDRLVLASQLPLFFPFFPFFSCQFMLCVSVFCLSCRSVLLACCWQRHI